MTHMKVAMTLFLSILLLGCGRENQEGSAPEGPPQDYKSIHQTQLDEAREQAEGEAPLRVQTGLDVLVAENFAALAGQRVGVITNHTGLTKDGRHIVDLLNEAENVELTAIFGPEHGVRGAAPAGAEVSSDVDPQTGVPIYSLYGKTRKPTPAMLENVDVLVFDIQDVGARFYTYIYTMALAMEAAAAHGKRFVVLDRPNPITGIMVQGPMLKEGYESFVGMFPMPVRHGMTVGELARMFKGEDWIDGAEQLDVQVVRMTGWQRPAWFDETDLPWMAPSPNMRTLATATVYPGTCFIEGTNVSEGRGTDKPFEKIGAPWIDGKRLAQTLEHLELPGVVFEPIQFRPAAILPAVPNPKFKNELCGGVLVRVTNRNVYQAVKTGVAIVWAIHELYPDAFAWRGSIDRLYGSDRLRKGVEAGASFQALVADYDEEIAPFLEQRRDYLLYE